MHVPRLPSHNARLMRPGPPASAARTAAACCSASSLDLLPLQPATNVASLHSPLHHRHIHTLQWHACAALACLLTAHSLASRAGCLCLLVLQVTQHAKCRVRVTVRKEPGEVPQQGHKVG